MIERWFCCSLFARHIHQNLHLTSTTAVPPLYWRARLCSFVEDFPGSLHPWRWTPKCWLFEFSVHRILKLDWNGFIVHPTVEVVLRKNYSFCRILFYLSREPARLDLKVLIVRSHFFVSESLNNSLMQWSNWRFCPESFSACSRRDRQWSWGSGWPCFKSVLQFYQFGLERCRFSEDPARSYDLSDPEQLDSNCRCIGVKGALRVCMCLRSYCHAF